ncbi:Uncharacterised protein [uncultured archaeon]|nr:Uncharacterised protein [uncultured archaeon]
MGLGEYKTIQTPASEVAALLRDLSVRLERLEERMQSLEARMPSAPAGPQAPAPMVRAAAIHGVSVSGSATPTSVLSAQREMLLAPADEQIMRLVRARGHVCATDVQIEFKYKGKNAASARLSRLYELGLLEKTQAGRTVYYRMRTPE